MASAFRTVLPPSAPSASRMIASTSRRAMASAKAKSPKSIKKKPNALDLKNHPDAMPLEQAARFFKAWEVGRLNASVDLSLVILPDKKKPSMRGQIVFPRNPSSKPSSLLVFCGENEVQQALAAGADLAGGPELFEQLQNGTIPLPTSCISTPAVIDQVTRVLGRFLGPKNLLPSTKRGTVVAGGSELVAAVKDNKGSVAFKVSPQGKADATVARPQWPASDLINNAAEFLEGVRLAGGNTGTLEVGTVKPNTITIASMSSTQGPSTLISDLLSRPRPKRY